MATLVLRTGKGSELTYVELDSNFTNLNTEVGGKATSATTLAGYGITDGLVLSASAGAALAASASAGVAVTAARSDHAHALPTPVAIGAAPQTTTYTKVETDAVSTALSATLAASGGSALVGTIGAGVGAVARTVQSKLRDAVSVKDFGAAGDGVTSDQTAVASAITATGKSLNLSPGDYLVTSLSNTNGVEFVGDGRIVKAVTGGNQQLNSYADKHKYVFGAEYLSHFHKRIIARSTVKKVYSGDSTTAGDSTSSTAYTIPALLQERALMDGFYNVTGVNAGHSGHSTVNWLSTWLSADLATNPNLYVIRWGINDPYTPGANLSVSQFLANIRSGLSTIRASKTLAQMSVVLMMPSSTNDTPNNRDERWYEAIANGMKQAARDYQCCFVDTYAYLQDSRNAADWMDDPYADGRHIHPNDVMNIWIASLLGDALFPSGLRRVSDNNMINASGSGSANVIKTAAATAATYPKGISMYRATPGGGGVNWPYDGAVITENHVDGMQMQRNFSYNNSLSNFAYRIGQGGVWQAWIDSVSVSVTGAWVPTIKGQSVAGTNTYSQNVGHYIAEGSMVTAYFQILMSAKDAAMSGNLQITGLPFIHDSAAAPYSAFTISRFSGITLTTGYTQVGCQGFIGNNSGLLIQSGSGMAGAAIQSSAITATMEIYGSVTYRR